MSVLIPTIPDRAAMFAECVASIHAQTLPRERWEIVSRCSSTWYPEKVNDLAQSARGASVLMIGDDDALLPAVSRCAATQQHARAYRLAANVQCFSAGGDGPIVRFDGTPWDFTRFRDGPPVWITTLVDRTRFLEAGGLNFAKLQYADWALWYELWKRGAKNAHLDDVHWKYRDHAGQASRQIDALDCRAKFFAAYPELIP